MNDLSDLREDVKDIKDHVMELVKQGAIQQNILEEHERRSTNLEARFEPIEGFHIFFSKLSGVIIALGGVLAAVAACKSLFFK